MSDNEVLVGLLDVACAVAGCFPLVHRVEVDACIVGPDELEKRWEHLRSYIPSVSSDPTNVARRPYHFGSICSGGVLFLSILSAPSVNYRTCLGAVRR